MVTKSFNSPDELINRLGYTDDSYGDSDIQEVIERAHRRMEGGVGTSVHEDVRFDEFTEDGEYVKEYQLDFRPVLEVEKVVVGNKRVKEEDYTINYSEGTITFTQSFFDESIGLRGLTGFRGVEGFSIKYVPKIMKDLEYWLTVYDMFSGSIVSIDEDNTNTSIEQAKEQAAAFSKQINRSSVMGTFSDGFRPRGHR